MCRINLQATGKGAVTLVSNVFIDRFMKDAKGTYVKVYLYLLRCLSDPSVELSLDTLADRLEETEGDITRALKYWERVGVLKLSRNDEGEVCDIEVTVFDERPQNDGKKAGEQQHLALGQTVPKQKPVYSGKQLEEFKSFDDFNEALDRIEQITGRTLSSKDLQVPAFLFECLGFSGEMIGYIFEYCFSKNKTSFSYVERVACDWFERGIKTVEQAQKEAATLGEELRAVRKSFGISREFGAAERKYILHWCNDLGMSTEMISEACTRSLMSTGKPDFKYADRILASWSEKNLTDLAQVKAADEDHKKTGARRKASGAENVVIPNKFNNYTQHTYSKEEMGEIEEMLLRRK